MIVKHKDVKIDSSQQGFLVQKFLEVQKEFENSQYVVLDLSFEIINMTAQNKIDTEMVEDLNHIRWFSPSDFLCVIANIASQGYNECIEILEKIDLINLTQKFLLRFENTYSKNVCEFKKDYSLTDIQTVECDSEVPKSYIESSIFSYVKLCTSLCCCTLKPLTDQKSHLATTLEDYLTSNLVYLKNILNLPTSTSPLYPLTLEYTMICFRKILSVRPGSSLELLIVDQDLFDTCKDLFDTCKNSSVLSSLLELLGPVPIQKSMVEGILRVAMFDKGELSTEIIRVLFLILVEGDQEVIEELLGDSFDNVVLEFMHSRDPEIRQLVYILLKRM